MRGCGGGPQHGVTGACLAAALVTLSPAVGTTQDGRVLAPTVLQLAKGQALDVRGALLIEQAESSNEDVSGEGSASLHEDEGGALAEESSDEEGSSQGSAEAGQGDETPAEGDPTGEDSTGEDPTEKGSPDSGEKGEENSISIDEPVFSRTPAAEWDGKRFSDLVEVKLTVRTSLFDALASTVDDGEVAWVGDDGVWSYSVGFGEGGPYTLPRVDAYTTEGECANNEEQVDAYGTFWVDRHAPSVTSARIVGAVASSYEEAGSVVLDGPACIVLEVGDEQGLASAELLPAGVGAPQDLGIQWGVTSARLELPLTAGEYNQAMRVRIVDLAGNMREWSLAPTGEVVSASESSTSNVPVSITLANGSVAEVHPQRVVIDGATPHLEVTGIEDGSVGSEPVTLHVRVSDDALAELVRCEPGQVVLKVTRRDASGSEEGYSVSLGELTRAADGSYMGDLELAEEGAYEVRSSVVDLAGRWYEADVLTFEIDQTAPAVHIEFDTSRQLFSQEQQARVVVNETHFDPDLVTIETSGRCGPWHEEGELHVIEVTFGAGTHHLSVEAADGAGNVAISQTVAPFTVDMQAPWVEGAALSGLPSRRYASGLVAFAQSAASLNIHVADNEGLAGAKVVDVDGTEGDLLLTANDGSGAKGSVSLDLSEGCFVDGAASLGVVDAAGNWGWATLGDVLSRALESSVPVSGIVLDGTAPLLELHGPAAGSYSAQPQTIRLEVQEDNLAYVRALAPSQRVCVVRQLEDGDERGVLRSWSLPVSSLVPTSYGGYLQETLMEDGVYEVGAYLEDVAGNVGEAYLGPFVIDGTAPSLDVTFDDGEEGNAFGHARTATIRIAEKNFDPALVELDTDGKVSSWVHMGSIHELRVAFDTDGFHDLKVSCVDKAGNRSATFESGGFLIDRTPPEVEVSGIDDGCAYGGEVQGTVTIRDLAGLDASSLEVTLVRGDGEEVAQPVVAFGDGAATITLPDLPQDQGFDDVYTLRITTRDQAGNVSTSSTRFSLNRFGSTFEVLNQDLAQGMPYVSKSPTVRVREINVSGAEVGKRAVWVTQDMLTRQLLLSETPAEGEFGVVDEADTRGWSCATYIIPRENFQDDATYRIVVGSEDLAGNHNLSLLPRAGDSSTEVSFTLDTTPPTVAIEGVEEGQVVQADSQAVDIMATDLVGVQDVSVLLDGERQEPQSLSEGRWRIEVQSKDATNREIEVVAHDLAGNEARAVVRNFRVEGASAGEGLPLLSQVATAAGKWDGRGNGGGLAVGNGVYWAACALGGGLLASAVGARRWLHQKTHGRGAHRGS